MWSLQRPGRGSPLVTCKTQRGLTCIGFGDNVSPDFSYRHTSAVVGKPQNLMIDEPAENSSKRIKFG
jgi:hypothetical protein